MIDPDLPAADFESLFKQLYQHQARALVQAVIEQRDEDWLVYWFALVLSKIYNDRLYGPIGASFSQQEITTVQQRPDRPMIYGYTQREEVEPVEDDDPPSPVYRMDGPGFVIPPRN